MDHDEFRRIMNPKYSSVRLSYQVAFHYVLLHVTDALGFESPPDGMIKHLHEVFFQTQQQAENVMMDGPIQPYDGDIEPDLLNRVNVIAHKTVTRLMAENPIIVD